MSKMVPMARVPSLSMPARVPALFFAGVLQLSGCSVLPGRQPAANGSEGNIVSSSGAPGDHGREAFTLEVQGPAAVRDDLDRHLGIQRYRHVDHLGVQEVSRLMVAAEANARELLATLGYFTPTLTLELHETPTGARAPHEVVIAVEPGALTHVSPAQIGFSGAIESDPEARAGAMTPTAHGASPVCRSARTTTRCTVRIPPDRPTLR